MFSENRILSAKAERINTRSKPSTGRLAKFDNVQLMSLKKK